MVEPILLSPAELAKKLGVCRAISDSLIRSGEISSVWVGARRKVPVEALTAWIKRKMSEGKT